MFGYTYLLYFILLFCPFRIYTLYNDYCTISVYDARPQYILRTKRNETQLSHVEIDLSNEKKDVTEFVDACA